MRSLALPILIGMRRRRKSANVARHQDWRTVFNSIVMCIFANTEPELQVKLINAACGFDWTIEDMMQLRRTRLEPQACHQQPHGVNACQ